MSPLSIAGYFAGAEAPPTDQEDDLFHIQGSSRFVEVGRWVTKQDMHIDTTQDPDEFLERKREENTVCYQGHQFAFDPQTGSMDVITQNTGHWGPNVYPGCGTVRAGENQYLQPQNYRSR